MFPPLREITDTVRRGVREEDFGRPGYTSVNLVTLLAAKSTHILEGSDDIPWTGLKGRRPLSWGQCGNRRDIVHTGEPYTSHVRPLDVVN